MSRNRYNTLPQDPGAMWLDHIKNNFYQSGGQLYKNNKSKPVGSKDRDGYKTTVLRLPNGQTNNYKNFKVHHLIWFLYSGSWPENELDHINDIRDDNRVENLRIVTRQENVNKYKQDPF